MWHGQPLKILRAAVSKGNAQPGQTLIHERLPAVGTSQDLLVLVEVQPAGKNLMPGKAFLSGARDWGSQNLLINHTP
jgi:methionyl-tRNA formyltransferase